MNALPHAQVGAPRPFPVVRREAPPLQLAPHVLRSAVVDDALRRRLDLMRMTGGERQAAVNALLLGRDIADLLLHLRRMMRRLIDTAHPAWARSHKSSSYRALIRARRARLVRRRAS